MYNLHLEERCPSHHDHLDLTIASHTLDPVRDVEDVSEPKCKKPKRNKTTKSLHTHHPCTACCSISFKTLKKKCLPTTTAHAVNTWNTTKKLTWMKNFHRSSSHLWDHQVIPVEMRVTLKYVCFFRQEHNPYFPFKKLEQEDRHFHIAQLFWISFSACVLKYPIYAESWIPQVENYFSVPHGELPASDQVLWCDPVYLSMERGHHVDRKSGRVRYMKFISFIYTNYISAIIIV